MAEIETIKKIYFGNIPKTHMKIKDGFVLRKICGEYIVIGEGLAQVNFNRMLSLNATAAFLWEAVAGKVFTEEDMIEALLEKYDVTREKAAEDVHSMIQKWEEQGIVE